MIRQARAGDAGAICRITNAIIRDSLITFTTRQRAPDEVAAEIAARLPAFLVAEENAQVLGFASFAQFRGGPGYAHTMEHSVQLASGARGRGIGRALMLALEEIARGQGVHVLVAGVSGANPGGLAFHRRLGFAEVGRMPETGRKAGQWLDLVLLQKILGPAAPEPADSGGAAG